MILLKSQRIIYQNHMDSVFMSGISGDQKLTANGIRGFAVKAFGILPIQVLFMRFQVQLRF